MKIIYIFERRHYYASDDIDFGIQYFIDQGYDIEVWSAVYWTFGKELSTPRNVHAGKLIYINNEKDIKHELNRVKKEPCCFIIYPYHEYSKVSYLIRKEIKKYGFDFYNLTESSSLMEVKEVPSKLKFILAGIKKIIYMIVILVRQVVLPNAEWKKKSVIFYRFWGPILFRSRANFVVTKNQLNYLANPWEALRKSNIFVPHADYGTYIKLSKGNTYDIESFAVFIDEYEKGHSDWEKQGITPPIKNVEEYYQELNNFFSIIERDLGLKVVIAAHPKAEYSGDEFGGREIRYFETAELIRKAKLVLYIYGSSITYILLYRKNFIHFYTGQHFRGHRVDSYIEKSRQRLNTTPVDISTLEEGINLLDYIKYYDASYDALKEKFIVPKDGMKEDMYMIIHAQLQKGKDKI